jgi:hypothetical protein
MSLEMAHKVILPPKKIISRSFLNSGTLIVNISTCYSSKYWKTMVANPNTLEPAFVF